VDTPIYQPVAGNAEKDHQVHAKIEELMVEHVIKAGKGRAHQPTGRDEDQPAVQFWLRAPIDGQRNAHRKGEHFIERDAQERVRVTQMELHVVEAGHDDGRGNAQRNHHGGEPDAKPSDEAMPTDLVHPDQRGLANEEDHPPGKNGRMNPENEGPRDGGMEQVVVDGAAEAGDHNRRQQQRHRKVEIPLQNPVTTGQGRRAQFFLRAHCWPDAFYLDSGH